MEIRKIDKLPEGAQKIHISPVQEVLRPRGSMAKESVGEYLLECLEEHWKYWTDPSYSDNPPKSILAYRLECNLRSEVEAALLEFKERHQIGQTERKSRKRGR